MTEENTVISTLGLLMLSLLCGAFAVALWTPFVRNFKALKSWCVEVSLEDVVLTFFVAVVVVACMLHTWLFRDSLKRL